MDQIKFPSVSVDYFNTLVNAYKSSSNQVILNPDEDHAEAALIYLYSKARKNVKIFCGDMSKKPDAKISSKLKEKWERIILDENISVQVIAENIYASSYRMKLLRENVGKFKNELFELNTEEYERLKKTVKNQKPFHFTTIDNESYRLEWDVENHKAFLNFNDPETAIRLNNNFELLKAKPIEEPTLV